MSRMNLNYERNTISWHRRTAIDSLKNKGNYQKINTLKYFRELKIPKSQFLHSDGEKLITEIMKHSFMDLYCLNQI